MAADPHAIRDDEAALVCFGVGKTWDAGTSRATLALSDIDLEMAPGELVVLLGPSGCGKSTLLYLIAGLEEATAGEMRFYGQAITAPSPERSLIFQDTSLFPWLTVWQNVTFGLALKGVGRDERRSVAQGDARHGRAARCRRQAAARALGRHAPAGGGGAGPRDAAEDAPDGRAVRRPRRPDAGEDAGLPRRCLARSPRPRSCSSPTTSTRRWRSPTG